ncbi:MAG: hypothetical protein ACE5GW_09925 [Planctomycetota bacterium]
MKRAFLVLLLAPMLLADQPQGGDPLAPLRGHRVVLEFPEIDHIGTALGVPSGWRYLQVAASSYDRLAPLLGDVPAPAIVYLDHHGNPILRDGSPGRRQKILQRAATVEKSIRELGRRLGRVLEEAIAARVAGREGRELEKLREVVDAGVRGYLPVKKARARLDELEEERLRRLLRVLAGEGIVPKRRLIPRLRALEKLSRGLFMEARIARERARIEGGLVVELRPRG